MKKLSVRLDNEQMEYIDQVADQENTSKGAIIRMAVDAYIKNQTLREDLIGFETRIAASINRLSRTESKIINDPQIVFAVLDQAVKFLLFTTREIPESEKEAAATCGNLRYENFYEELRKSMVEVKSRTKEVLDE